MSSDGDLLSRLLGRAARYAGQDPRKLVDEEGDVQVCDSPFGVWARLAPGPRGTCLLLIAGPLLEVAAQPGLEAAVSSCIAATSIASQLGDGSIQLFELLSLEVLDSQEAFEASVRSFGKVGAELVAAVQPRFGGLTAEQQRVLRGWRGHDRQVDADMASLAAQTGARALRHGWDPETESVPLLVLEETGSEWAKRFVTVEREGAVRFRSTVAERRGAAQGFSLRIVRLDAAAAMTWATRLGLTPRGPTLHPEDLRPLVGTSWTELTAPLPDLPHDWGHGWEPARGGPLAA